MNTPSDTSVAQAALPISERLNRQCLCITLDRDALYEALQREVGDPDFCTTLVNSRPHLFSNAPVFLSESDATEMLRIVQAIEAVARLPSY